MTETKLASDPQTIMDGVISALREGRNKAMQQRKAAVQKEFMIARRWVEDAYQDFGPEDLPVDVHRVRRDLAVTRDQLIDRECEEIDREYRVAVSVLKIVAVEHPGYYCAADKATKTGKNWKRPLPVVVAPKATRVLPSKVLEGLSSTDISKIVDVILSAKEGVSFRELAKRLKLDGAAKLQTRAAAKQFVGYLRTSRHVTVVGSGRGQKMKATKQLRELLASLISAPEAANGNCPA